MKLRKILATSLAIAMAVATLNVAPAKADVIDSQTSYLDKEVYDVTLPTTASQKFYLDPQGLSDAVFGTSNAGKIIGATTMTAINNSSMPVNMEVKAIVIASSAAVTVTTGAISSFDNVGSGPALNLKITTTSAKVGKVVSKGGIAAGTTLSSADDLFAAITGAAISSEVYGLEAGDYQVVTKAAIDSSKLDEVFDSSNYDYKMTASGAAIDLVIGGECTQKTDWTDFSNGTQELKLDITFKLTKEDLATEIDANKFSYNAGNGFYFFDIPGAAATSITAATFDGADCMAGVTSGNIAINTTLNRIGIKDNAPFLSSVNVGDPHTFAFTLNDGRSFTVKFVKQ